MNNRRVVHGKLTNHGTLIFVINGKRIIYDEIKPQIEQCLSIKLISTNYKMSI